MNNKGDDQKIAFYINSAINKKWYTVEVVRDQWRQMTDYGLNEGQAKSSVKILINNDIKQPCFATFASMAYDYAIISDNPLNQSLLDVIKAFTSNIAGVEELNRKFPFLTAEQFDYIQKLASKSIMLNEPEYTKNNLEIIVYAANSFIDFVQGAIAPLKKAREPRSR